MGFAVVLMKRNNRRSFGNERQGYMNGSAGESFKRMDRKSLPKYFRDSVERRGGISLSQDDAFRLYSKFRGDESFTLAVHKTVSIYRQIWKSTGRNHEEIVETLLRMM